MKWHSVGWLFRRSGSPNLFMAMPVAGFRYVKGSPKQITRADLERAVTREFCAACGTHIVTRAPGFPVVILRVCSMGDPAKYGGSTMAIYTCDKQGFHRLPEGFAAFERLPG